MMEHRMQNEKKKHIERIEKNGRDTDTDTILIWMSKIDRQYCIGDYMK